MKRKTTISFLVMLVLILALLTAMNVGAQEPSDCANGECPGETAGQSAEGVEAEGLGAYRRYGFRGGYVANGTGLRNRGWGTIKLSGIPSGSTVYKAFLYWSVVDFWQSARHARGKFNGNNITGTYIGADHETCWLSDDASSYSYRADVTQYVKGNGNYYLRSFASGLTDGSDPWSAPVKTPLIQGASLVVLFQNSSYPWTRFVIWDGSATVPDTNSQVFIQLGGFSTSNPVGPTYTTFIGGDGQNSPEPASRVNYNDVAAADWDGTDPQAGGNYSNGNLWDTDTASVGMYLSPGQTSVRIDVSGSPDCLNWVAQVFSTSSGTLDTDKDALPDGWEANGYNGVDLPGMGASPWHKDVFVEHDWMDGPHNHMPSWTVLNNVRKAYAAAPVSNPDGVSGIILHNDLSNSVPHQNDVSASCATLWAGFDAIKNANFAANRADIFHYNLWAHDLCPDYGSTSGISRGIPASDYIVSLGSWPSYGDTAARTGTFMHELGHNVGLTHGGNTGDHENYKPNHLSIMNYSFQVLGVWRDNARRWDYTRMWIWALNEANLNEFTGLNGSQSLASYGTRYYVSGSPVDDNTADTNVDWNGNGIIQASVSADINKSGGISTLGTVHNQWSSLIYNGGSIGPGMPAAGLLSAEEFTDVSQCLTFEDAFSGFGSE